MSHLVKLKSIAENNEVILPNYKSGNDIHNPHIQSDGLFPKIF
jgi:hypothetical protein